MAVGGKLLELSEEFAPFTVKEYTVGREVFPYRQLGQVGWYVVPRVPSLPNIVEFLQGRVGWEEACVVHDVRNREASSDATRRVITAVDFLQLADGEKTATVGDRWNLVPPTAPHSLFCHCLCIQRPLVPGDTIVADMRAIDEEEGVYLFARFGEGVKWALTQGAYRVSVGGVYGPWRSQTPNHFHLTGFENPGSALSLAELQRVDPQRGGLFGENEIGVVTMHFLAEKLRTQVTGLDEIFDLAETESSLPFSSGSVWIPLRGPLPEILQRPEMVKIWAVVEELIEMSWLEAVSLYEDAGILQVVDIRERLCFAIAGFQTRESERGILAVMAAEQMPDGLKPQGGVVEAMGDVLHRPARVADFSRAALFHRRNREFSAVIAGGEFDEARFADVYTYLWQVVNQDTLANSQLGIVVGSN